VARNGTTTAHCVCSIEFVLVATRMGEVENTTKISRFDPLARSFIRTLTVVGLQCTTNARSCRFCYQHLQMHL
jgi:hypothetical protein